MPAPGARIENSPVTYELDNRQYVLVGSGGVLFAWALPERPATSRHPVAKAH